MLVILGIMTNTFRIANTGLAGVLADSKYQFGWNTLNWTDCWPSV